MTTPYITKHVKDEKDSGAEGQKHPDQKKNELTPGLKPKVDPNVMKNMLKKGTPRLTR